MSFLCADAAGPAIGKNQLREAVRQLDANLPVYELKTVDARG